MNAADFFAAAAKLPTGTLADVTGVGGLVIVAPHPDDESLGCGGLIAEACARGTPVRLVVVSDGVGSHPNSRCYPPEKLRELREDETRRATAALGLAASAIRFLRLPDRYVPTQGGDAERAKAAILEAAREVAAGAVCVTWQHDPHCDHAACAALVAALRAKLPGVRLLAYPIWGLTLPPDTEVGPAPRGLRLAVHSHVAAKAAAIAAHRSQTTDLIDDAPGFRLTPEMIARFTGGDEIFLEIEPQQERYGQSIPAAYFDDLYARDPDPWRFASSPYEREKYAATLAALPRAHYASVLEVGCSIGVLTRQLADRTDALLAIDLATDALEEARRRCADHPLVRFDRVRVPEQWPAGRFDLILLSEVVYYLDRRDVAALAERVAASIAPGGDIVLVHWLGETHYPLSGDDAAEMFMASIAARGVGSAGGSRTDDYRLDVLRAPEAI